MKRDAIRKTLRDTHPSPVVIFDVEDPQDVRAVATELGANFRFFTGEDEALHAAITWEKS